MDTKKMANETNVNMDEKYRKIGINPTQQYETSTHDIDATSNTSKRKRKVITTRKLLHGERSSGGC